MKGTLLRWSAAAGAALGVGLGSGYAQSQPAACAGIVATTDVVNGHPNWNWEVPVTDPNYGKMWSAYTYNSGSAGRAIVLGAPWFTNSDPRITQMANTKDYTKDKGWMLVRVNFGCPAAEAYPNFVLYNKYTGILRVFVYLENMGTGYQGVVISLKQQSFSGSNRITAATSGNRRYIRTPDYYQNTAFNGSNEVVSMVNRTAGAVKWSYTDFSMMFDPNAGSNLFATNNLIIEIHGTRQDNLTLAGNLSFTTDVVGMTGTAQSITSANNTKTFSTQGQKVVGRLSNMVESGQKATDKVHTAAVTIANYTFNNAQGPPNPDGSATFGKKLHTTVTRIADATDASGGIAKTLKSVLQVAGAANAALGLLGTVAGLLWPDDSDAAKATPFTPTISTGEISLTGTITTDAPLNTINIQQPGTQHNSNAVTQLPYYDCGLGVFNISNTPVLQKSNVQTETVLNKYEYWPLDPNTPQDPGSQWSMRSEDMVTYKVSSSINPVYNAKAGLTPISVEAAIGLRGRSHSLAEVLWEPEPTGDFSNGTSGTIVYESRNVFLEQLGPGNLVFNTVEGDTLEFQTPFVSASCLQNVTCRIPSSFKPFLRVKATFKRNDSPNSPPIYFVYDYAVNITSNPGLMHTFTYDTPGEDALIENTTIQTAGAAANVTNTATVRDVTFASGSSTAYVRAGKEVALLAEFGVAAGNEFYAESSYLMPSCGTDSSPALALSNCEANPNTWWRSGTQVTSAQSAAAADKGLELFPNPTTGAFTLDPHLKGQEKIKVIIHNYIGQQVYKRSFVYTGQGLVLRDANLKPGLYVVEVLSEKAGKQTTRLKVE